MEPDDWLSIPADVHEAIVSHAREEAPRECCGLLLGAGRQVVRAVRTRNALDSTTRFLVDAADHFAVLREARASGLSIIGAYHSHPTSPPVPSGRDLEEAAYDFVYLIVGLASPAAPDVRAFDLKERNFRPLRLVLSS